MPLELSQLMQLVAGQRQFVVLGNVPERVRSQFQCHPGVVYLRHQEALHIVGRHSDVRSADLLQIGLAIERGAYYRDRKRERCASVLFYNFETKKPYLIGLKFVDGCEVWVSTFHHFNDVKVRQRLKDSELICGSKPRS